MGSFKDVVGHKNIIKYIESAVQADAVSHAYICLLYTSDAADD